jgi:SanA protein
MRLLGRRTKRLAMAVAIVLATAIVAANAVVLRGGRERGVAGPVDCALVLGAGVAEDGTPSWVLEDRLSEALRLYQSGRVKTILVSGDHRARSYDEPNAMRLWLEARGVPPSVIFMDHAGVDTYSSVWRAKHVFGAARLVVVTQRFHLPRALWMARSIGMDAEGAAADRRPYRGALWFEAREVMSRTKAFVDVTGGRRPRHVGPRVPLDQDGRVTAG